MGCAMPLRRQPPQFIQKFAGVLRQSQYRPPRFQNGKFFETRLYLCRPLNWLLHNPGEKHIIRAEKIFA
jgi:hypothetical protein